MLFGTLHVPRPPPTSEDQHQSERLNTLMPVLGLQPGEGHCLPSQYLWADGPKFQPSPGSAKAHKLPNSSSLLSEAGFPQKPSQALPLVQSVVPGEQGHPGYGELEYPGHQLEGHVPLKTRS